MKISELITHLEAQKSKYGDIDVKVYGSDGTFTLTRDYISYEKRWCDKFGYIPARLIIKGYD